MRGNFSWLHSVLFASSIALLSSMPVSAALTNADIVNAIKQGQFLAPGSSLNVRIDNDQVFVSTFKHSNDDKDCKIDAALISKAVFDTSPEGYARVTCYFYGKDMASYQEISVSAGDIKAFATGSMSKEQLLASLVVKTGSTQGSDRIARQLESNWISRPSDYKISEDKGTITVNTALDSWVPDEDAKFEALRIAVNTFTIQPTAQKINVNFVDPTARVENREVSFTTSSLEGMWKPIQNSLASLPLVKKAAVIELASMQTVKGPMQDERNALLAKLKDMEKKGIGVVPFVKVFMGIEQSVKANADAKTIADSVNRLNLSIEDQLKRSASAKDRPKAVTKAPDPAPVSTGPVVSSGSRWAGGKTPIIPEEVLANPDQAAQRQESSFGAKASSDPKFANALDQIARILTQNNRASEAAKFQARAAEIRTRKP